MQTVLERNPFCGHVFIFRGKRGEDYHQQS
ncbi:hypothetical protein [Caballeronia udeis]